jgi:hypothetical protein
LNSNQRAIVGVSAIRLLVIGVVGLLSAASKADDFGDTPYVQTPANVVKAMLETAKVGPKDFVIDLGSGDGRMVITAATQYGARGFGVDLDARLVRLANQNAAKAGVSDRAMFYARDLYKTDVHRATVVSIYLLPEVNLMVRPKLLRELRPGTRVVSHDYDMGDWPPDAQFTLDAPGKSVGRDPVSQVFYWVVPANVTGQWSVSARTGAKLQAYSLTFSQKFQHAQGTIEAGSNRGALQEVKLVGPRLSFKARLPDASGREADYEFVGRVAGDSMEGTLRQGATQRSVAWRAHRVGGKVAVGPEVDPKLEELKRTGGVQ